MLSDIVIFALWCCLHGFNTLYFGLVIVGYEIGLIVVVVVIRVSLSVGFCFVLR